MPLSQVLTVGAAAAAAFVLGFVWYMLWGSRLAQFSPVYAVDRPTTVGVAATELGRCLLIATAMYVLARWTGAGTAASGVLLGLIAWLGFPLPLLVGSVVHEGYSWRLAAVHLGDWLIKLILVGGIVAVWR